MSHFISPEDLLELLRPTAEKYLWLELTPATLIGISAECNYIVLEEIGKGNVPEGAKVEVRSGSAFGEIEVTLDPTPWHAPVIEEIPPTPIPTMMKEEKKLNNIVIITHSANAPQYLFAVPEGIRLQKGEQVIVRTRRGEKFGTCDCDSFVVEDDTLQALAKRFAATLPLKPVIGRSAVVRFGEETAPCAPDEELQTEVETLQIENARLRDEIARLHRENFWLTNTKPEEIGYDNETPKGRYDPARYIEGLCTEALLRQSEIEEDEQKGEN